MLAILMLLPCVSSVLLESEYLFFCVWSVVRVLYLSWGVLESGKGEASFSNFQFWTFL